MHRHQNVEKMANKMHTNPQKLREKMARKGRGAKRAERIVATFLFL